MEYHHHANIFPLMEGEPFMELIEDIRINGLLEPVTIYEEKILDGRNRYRACVEAGITPRFEYVDGSINTLQFVISKNLKRRHLNETQRAGIAARLANMERGGNGSNQFSKSANLPISISQSEAAELLNVGERTIRTYKSVSESMPELIPLMDNGTMTAHEADMKLKHKQIKSSHAAKRAQVIPDGKYHIIYADPPWQYRNNGFDEAAENQYPTMPTEDICKLPIGDMATDTTVLFLWSTNPLLLEALQVMNAWGFEYKTNITWVKDRGRGKGWFLKSKHELLLIGVRENSPHPTERPDSAQEAERGNVHSRKPELFYKLIESMYPEGKKIELFARTEREGWASWGNEW